MRFSSKMTPALAAALAAVIATPATAIEVFNEPFEPFGDFFFIVGGANNWSGVGGGTPITYQRTDVGGLDTFNVSGAGGSNGASRTNGHATGIIWRDGNQPGSSKAPILGEDANVMTKGTTVLSFDVICNAGCWAQGTHSGSIGMRLQESGSGDYANVNFWGTFPTLSVNNGGSVNFAPRIADGSDALLLELTLNLDNDTVSITTSALGGAYVGPETSATLSLPNGFAPDELQIYQDQLHPGGGFTAQIDNIVIDHVIPEPASMVLLGLACLSLLARRRHA